MSRRASTDKISTLEDAIATENPLSLENNVDFPRFRSASQKITDILIWWGVETHGICPVPEEKRVDKRLYQLFFMWFSANFNISAFSTGSAGPAFFNLGIRDSLIIITIALATSSIIPAIVVVFGPKLGMRGMVQSRYSWGYYGAIIPSILNVISSEGYLIINCIIGGQTLASISGGRINDTIGIFVIGLFALMLTFSGTKLALLYTNFSWIPNAVTFIVILGVSGHHLNPSTFPLPTSPATAAIILSFFTLVAAFVITWSTFCADYGLYHDKNASSFKIFLYSYLGFLTSTLPLFMLGAVFAAKAPDIPSWEAGFKHGTNIGGLFAAVLAPAGGFGKFLVVMIALSIPATCAPTMYGFSNSLMAISPAFARVPRYFYAIISTGILIPVAIVGQTRFYGTLTNIFGVAGYWVTIFVTIVLVEHFVFRRADWTRYHPESWNKPRELPLGAAAVLTFISTFALIVPCMSHSWYVGPIARLGTGDIGVFVGLVASAVTYLVLRSLELKFFW